MTYSTQAPFIASYVIFEKDGKVAFVLRANTDWMNDYYGLPSGKVEKGESYTTAAIREAKEEVGVSLKPEQLEVIHVMHRNEPSDKAAEWVDVFFKAKSWTGELINAEPHVHSEVAWLDTKSLPKNVIPSVAFAFGQMNTGKQFSEYGFKG